MSATPETGLVGHRPLWVEETTTADGDPETPADPAFKRFSDTVRSFEWSGSPEHEAVRGLGDAAPDRHEHAPETHSITITYDLQKWLANDAANDGLVRDADNQLQNTHTVTDREEKAGLAANSTINGTNSLDTRIYTVGRGGHIDSVTITGDPGSQQPVVVELTYEFEKVRSYQVDQPSASTTLTVVSDDASDTTQTLTVEDESGTSEDIALNGTTAVTGLTSFSDIDALELSGETAGNITVSDGTNDLAVIHGSNYYDSVEGDLGIPAIGSGSKEAAIGTSYEKFLGDTITRGGDYPVGALDINSFELTVSNNTDRTVREDSYAQRVNVGIQDVEVTATLFGETVSHVAAEESFGTTTGDIVWTLTGGTITVPQAVVTDPGGRTYEAEQNAFTPDTVLMGEGVTIA